MFTVGDVLNFKYGGAPKKKVWMGLKPSHCDLCQQQLSDKFVDGSTGGPWAIMCIPCHGRHGMGSAPDADRSTISTHWRKSMDKTIVGIVNYDPPTNPERLVVWESMREILKKRHKCQCFQCVWKALWKMEEKLDG